MNTSKIPTPFTAYGRLHETSSDTEIHQSLTSLTYGYEFLKGHAGQLGELRDAVIRGEQILPGRTKKQSLTLIRAAIQHFHDRAKREGLIKPSQRLAYRVQRTLHRR